MYERSIIYFPAFFALDLWRLGGATAEIGFQKLDYEGVRLQPNA